MLEERLKINTIDRGVIPNLTVYLLAALLHFPGVTGLKVTAHIVYRFNILYYAFTARFLKGGVKWATYC